MRTVTTYDGGKRTFKQTTNTANVNIDYEDLNPRGGFGAEIVEIEVQDGDKITKFWIRVRDNGHGRVACEVSTNVGERSVRKSVTGSWRRLRFDEKPEKDRG